MFFVKYKTLEDIAKQEGFSSAKEYVENIKQRFGDVKSLADYSPDIMNDGANRGSVLAMASWLGTTSHATDRETAFIQSGILLGVSLAKFAPEYLAGIVINYFKDYDEEMLQKLSNGAHEMIAKVEQAKDNTNDILNEILDQMGE